jgi:hypothetical protein
MNESFVTLVKGAVADTIQANLATRLEALSVTIKNSGDFRTALTDPASELSQAITAFGVFHTEVVKEGQKFLVAPLTSAAQAEQAFAYLASKGAPPAVRPARNG